MYTVRRFRLWNKEKLNANMKYDVIVIGGGPAGLVAAGTAAKRGKSVLLIERNEKIGRKLMITGKGRCNVTNACTLLNELIENVPVNGRFLYGAFSRFMPYDTMELFENLGVPLKIERGNRVFPESDRASDIVDALRRYITENGVKTARGRVVEMNTESGCVSSVRCEDGKEYEADGFIIATGGKSYPLTGSTGDGYMLASRCGHRITEPKPALVPLECEEEWCSKLQGLSLKNIEISVYDNEKFTEVYRDFGEMLFTHFGVSGPVILSASSHMKNGAPGRYSINIDLKPALDFDKLDKRIQRDFAEFSNKAAVNALSALLPRKLIPVVTELCEIPSDLRTNQITREQRHELVSLLKALPLTVGGFRPIDEAIVTSGGVDVRDIDPKTMRSKIINNLYFAGEVIDADAYTGGFNLQIAFSTGMLAGNSI